MSPDAGGGGGGSDTSGMSGTDASAGSGGSGSGSGGSDAAFAADRGTGGTPDSGPGAVDVPAATDVSSAEVPAAMLPPGVPAGYKLLLDESFASAGSVMAILAGNPADWTHGDQEGGFLQYGGVGYAPPNPPVPDDFTSFALLRAMRFGSFVLEVELMQRNPNPTAVQIDMCIIFGIRSETELYFAHMAQGHTERFHNIVIINNAPRRSITKTDNGGVRWGMNQWHKVRLVRDVATGNTAVYMDGDLMTAPILTATDTTFAEGYVGFGTHEDSGRIRNLKIWGPSAIAAPAPANFFR